MFQQPLRRVNLQDDSVSLMTDVWTFMAILGLCLSVIFALVQSLPFAAEGNRPKIQGQELARMEMDGLAKRQEQLKAQVRELRSEADRLRDTMQKMDQSERTRPDKTDAPDIAAENEAISSPDTEESQTPIRSETDTLRSAMLLARLNTELSAARARIQELEAQVDQANRELRQALGILDRMQPHQPIPEAANPRTVRARTASAEQTGRDVAAELERLNLELETALEQHRAADDQRRAAREEREAALREQAAATPSRQATTPPPASTSVRTDPAPGPRMESAPPEMESATRDHPAPRRPQPEPRDIKTRAPVAPPSSEPSPSASAPRNESQGFTLRFASEQALTNVLLRNEAQFYLIAGGRAWKLRNPSGTPSFQPTAVQEKLYEMHRDTVPESYLAASRTMMVSGGGASFYVALSSGIQRQLKTLTAGAAGGKLIIHADGRVTLE
jgi:hypothetical protein